MDRRLPVTLVGGFSGAGKTSLLHHFITEHRGGFLAVLVESGGAPNLDAQAIKGLCGAMGRLHDVVCEIPAGEETAQVEWLAAKLHELSLEGRFERVLVEVGGTLNAARLGPYFGLLPDQPDTLAPWAQLQQIICVVDALDFYRGVVTPSRRRERAPFVDFLHAQIEGASLLVLNKCDLIGDVERVACVELLHTINPDAPFLETAYGEVPPEIWARTATGQELALAVEKRLRPRPEGDELGMEAVESGLSRALYRAYRPFHPGRFWDWFQNEHPGLLRVKGLIWLATRNLLVGGISRTRWQNGCGGAGIWWAALPREEWPSEREALARMQENWREPYGDRRQELVLLGDAARLGEITRHLNGCLLTAEEYARPVSEWRALPDPFPAWDVGDESA